jgi:hypothetical protein
MREAEARVAAAEQRAARAEAELAAMAPGQRGRGLVEVRGHLNEAIVAVKPMIEWYLHDREK